MKKFSNIAKIEVSSEKEIKENKDLNSYKELRYLIESLIDDFLHIRIEGPINPILQGTILIDGKNEFIDAIIESFSMFDDKKELKVLESARNRFILNDLAWIEKEINNKEEKINEFQTAIQIIKHEEVINDIYKLAKGNIEEAIRIANLKSKKMKDGKKVFYRAMAAEKLSTKKDKKIMLAIASVYMAKAKELGYTPQNSYTDKSTRKL
jgi:hypothetical protein